MTPGITPSTRFGSFAPADLSKTLLACPQSAAQKNTGPWVVYVGPGSAAVPSGNTDDCWAFSIRGKLKDVKLDHLLIEDTVPYIVRIQQIVWIMPKQ